MKIQVIVGAVILFLVTGCVVPVNSTFESADILDEKEFSVQGQYSHYSSSASANGEALQRNMGVAIGYGVTDHFNMKVRYEWAKTISRPLGTENYTYTEFNYLEITPTIRLIEDRLAMGFPLGYYTTASGGDLMFQPRLLLTHKFSNHFDITAIPKVQLRTDHFPVQWALNLGMGFSSDLNKWAFRPELGFDNNFTYGFGLVFRFKRQSVDELLPSK